MYVHWKLSFGRIQWLEEYSAHQLRVNKLYRGTRKRRGSLCPPQWNSHSTLHLMSKNHVHQFTWSNLSRGIYLGDRFCWLLQGVYILNVLVLINQVSHVTPAVWQTNPTTSLQLTDLYLWKSPWRKPCCCWDSFTIWRTGIRVKADWQYSVLSAHHPTPK